MIRLVVGLLLAGMTHLCQAQSYVAQFPPNPGVMPGGGWQYSPGSNFGDPPGPRQWTNGKYGGIPKFQATDLYRLPGPSGVLPVAVVSAVGLGEAALAVGRCVVGLNPICAAGTAAWLVWDKYRARPVTPGANSQVCGGVPCDFPSGQFDWDPGQDPTSGGSQDCYTWVATNGGAQTACVVDQAAAIADARSQPGTQTFYPGYPEPPQQRACFDFGSTVIQSPTAFYINAGTATSNATACTPFGNGANVNRGPAGTIPGSTSCPASIDAIDPQYSIPAGQPVGFDGKCPSGRHNHVPRTPEQLQPTIEQFPPNLPNADWGRAVSDAIDLGGQKAPASLTGSGPAAQTGNPVTTSAPNPAPTGGSTTTTTTSTTNYTYNNTTNNYPAITYSTVNNYNTNTCTASGTCNTSSGSNAGASSGTPLQDPTDPCVKNPGALQCLKVGEPGAEKPTWETKTITYEPEAVDLPAQCPAPWTGQFKGQAWVVSFTPACDIAPIIKAALLACVGLGCMLFLSREVV